MLTVFPSPSLSLSSLPSVRSKTARVHTGVDIEYGKLEFIRPGHSYCSIQQRAQDGYLQPLGRQPSAPLLAHLRGLPAIAVLDLSSAVVLILVLSISTWLMRMKVKQVQIQAQAHRRALAATTPPGLISALRSEVSPNMAMPRYCSLSLLITMWSRVDSPKGSASHSTRTVQ